jgi:hypothetical protein
MHYNLTDNQKNLLRFFVSAIRKGDIPEEFSVIWGINGPVIHFKGASDYLSIPEISKSKLEALQKHDLLSTRSSKTGSVDALWIISITAKGFSAVDNNFLEETSHTECEHTLLAYWKRATLEERFGMISLFSLVYFVGYLSAQASFFSRAINLIREILP